MTPTWTRDFDSKCGKWSKGTWLNMSLDSFIVLGTWSKVSNVKKKRRGKKGRRILWKILYIVERKMQRKKPFFCFSAHLSSISATDCAWSPAALLTCHGTVISKSTALRGNNNFFLIITGLSSSLNFSAAFPTACQVCNYHYWKLLFKEVQLVPEAAKGSEL